jgi:hypothetical protein
MIHDSSHHVGGTNKKEKEKRKKKDNKEGRSGSFSFLLAFLLACGLTWTSI